MNMPVQTEGGQRVVAGKRNDAFVDHPSADISLDMLWNALEFARWAPHALESWLPDVLAHADELEPQQRIPWLIRLRQAAHDGWAVSMTVRESLLSLASDWCDWPLLKMLGERLEAIGQLPEWAEPSMVQACLKLGDPEAALLRCRSLALRYPQEQWILDTYGMLQSWIDFADRIAPPIISETLRLEPMGHHHVDDFSCQYYDPDIAERCCLPAFANETEWHQWLDQCWSYGDQRLYAVIHPDWGFIGSVSLILHDGIGFFYYWLGRDFQGNGIGPEAAQLLLDDAQRHYRMRACYAKAFVDNRPSHRALEKVGFSMLDFQCLPSNETERFYRLGESQSRERNITELRTLFEQMGSEIRVAVPFSTHQRAVDTPVITEGHSGPEWHIKADLVRTEPSSP